MHELFECLLYLRLHVLRSLQILDHLVLPGLHIPSAHCQLHGPLHLLLDFLLVARRPGCLLRRDNILAGLQLFFLHPLHILLLFLYLVVFGLVDVIAYLDPLVHDLLAKPLIVHVCLLFGLENQQLLLSLFLRKLISVQLLCHDQGLVHFLLNLKFLVLFLLYLAQKMRFAECLVDSTLDFGFITNHLLYSGVHSVSLMLLDLELHHGLDTICQTILITVVIYH